MTGSQTLTWSASRIIDRIDYDARKVHINLSKEQIREAPDYDTEREREEAYRQDVGTYYGPYFCP